MLKPAQNIKTVKQVIGANHTYNFQYYLNRCANTNAKIANLISNVKGSGHKSHSVCAKT